MSKIKTEDDLCEALCNHIPVDDVVEQCVLPYMYEFKLYKTIQGHTNRVNSVCFNESETQIVSGVVMIK